MRKRNRYRNLPITINHPVLRRRSEDALKVAGIEKPDPEADGIEYEVTSESASGDDRYESTDKNGKPIPSRYQKHFYCVTVEVDVEVKYPVPNGDPLTVTVNGIWTDECQASGMDELV